MSWWLKYTKFDLQFYKGEEIISAIEITKEGRINFAQWIIMIILEGNLKTRILGKSIS